MFTVTKHNMEILDDAGLTAWDGEDIIVIRNRESQRVWVHVDLHGDGVIESFATGEKIIAYDTDNEEHVSAVRDILSLALRSI